MKITSIILIAWLVKILCLTRAEDLIQGGSRVETDKNDIKVATGHGVRGAALLDEDSPSSTSDVTFRVLKKNKKKGNNKGPPTSPSDNSNSVNDHPKIIGGTNAAAGQYPYFASIISSSSYVCGAALVAPDMLITAGHCTEAFQKGAIVGNVKLGVKTSGSVQVSIVQQIIDPDYQSFEHNDVMLLKISPAVTSIAPVAINFSPSLPFAGEPLEIIGFGKTANTGSVSSVLKQAQVYEVSASKCKAVYGSTIIPTQHICVVNTKPFRGTCGGDSGGPLLGKGTGSTSSTTFTFGVTSFGSTTCTSGYSVFTRFSGYYSFIQGTICQNSANPPAYLGCSGSQAPKSMKQNKKMHQQLCSSRAETCSTNQDCCSGKCKQGACK